MDYSKAERIKYLNESIPPPQFEIGYLKPIVGTYDLVNDDEYILVVARLMEPISNYTIHLIDPCEWTLVLRIDFTSATP